MRTSDKDYSVDKVAQAQPPRVWRRLFALFALYSRWYLGRHFHAVRLLGPLPRVDDDRALVVYLNHPSWWDPLIAILLASGEFPRRTHYGPIDAAALQRYGFFRRLGFFGVETGTVRGARRFLRLSEALLERGGETALWITPEGRFTDPRQRPVRLRPGLGRLALRLAERRRAVTLLPLAVEYVYWEERFPEVLVTWGEPLAVEKAAAELGAAASPARWDALLAERLQMAQERLASAAVAREASAFTTLLRGRAGVGAVYDLWRALRAWLRGESFARRHGGGGVR